MSASAGGKPRRKKEETDEERRMRLLKEEAARELGLWDKVVAGGWGGLTAAESGRIGGVVARNARGLKDG
ncbi:small acid-soluble spore protein [mine drainage metagenome]|uniref:Small acid-soluble spore protein n=1 Tax=mine drainage metagenome TaxID=410659 RepID=T0XZ13_9ZZZZ